jgi:precorrin-6B methylase 2
MRSLLGDLKNYVRSVLLSGGVFDQSGFYRVAPPYSKIEPFYLWLPDAKTGYRQACIKGTLEPPVMSAIAEAINEDTVFWDVGALRGYFSFACAGVVDQVRCFEANSRNAEIIRKGVRKNSFQNVDVIEGYVGQDVSLDDFDPPDLILMDTEGWEYEILRDSKETLRAGPTWVIELHEHGEATDAETILPNEVNPEGVLQMFEEAGYQVRTIKEYSNRCHISAYA